jgi:hypothetical protein
MEYKIISASSQIGQINVEFSDGGKVLGVYAVDVPIVNGEYITGPALDAEIMQRAPTWLVQRQSETQAASNFSAIAALAVGQASAQLSLDQYKELRLTLINRFREKVLAAGVNYNGHTFDSDNVSVSRLTAVSNLALAGGSLPAGFVWRSADNVDVPFTATDVFSLLGAMIARANAVFSTSWAKKQAVMAATTKAGVDAVTWYEPGISDGIDETGSVSMSGSESSEFVVNPAVL